MSEQPHTPPYRTLGKYLKTIRQKLQESLRETSGAVEIDAEKLDRYERGIEAPNEDILLLLISHFGLRDDEAVELWELAGYSRSDPQLAATIPTHDEPVARPAQLMLLAFDNRVLYSNAAEIVSDDSGVVLSFLQTADKNQSPAAISRIGMSYEQAEKLIDTLGRALLHKRYAGPKALPGPQSFSNPQNPREPQE